MTQDEIKRFGDFLQESFNEDMYIREMRLSDEEKEHLERKYSKIRLNRMGNGQCSDGKFWYEIR